MDSNRKTMSCYLNDEAISGREWIKSPLNQSRAETDRRELGFLYILVSPDILSYQTNSSFLLEALAAGLWTTYCSFSLSSETHHTWNKRLASFWTRLRERGEHHRGKSDRWWSPVSAPCPCPSRSGPRSSAGRRAGLWFWAAGSWWGIVSEGRAAAAAPQPDYCQSKLRRSGCSQWSSQPIRCYLFLIRFESTWQKVFFIITSSMGGTFVSPCRSWGEGQRPCWSRTWSWESPECSLVCFNVFVTFTTHFANKELEPYSNNAAWRKKTSLLHKYLFVYTLNIDSLFLWRLCASFKARHWWLEAHQVRFQTSNNHHRQKTRGSLLSSLDSGGVKSKDRANEHAETATNTEINKKLYSRRC